MWHENEWWFSVVDVVGILVESENNRFYWGKLKERLMKEENFQLLTFCQQLKLTSLDGKMRETDCANTEGLFRIIQSIPSPKAEPFKRWLAKFGYERVQEIQNPELARERMRSIYAQKGYPRAWIEKRLQGITVRLGLTDEWRERGLSDDKDFAILTSEISKATFGMTPSEYKKYKGLPVKGEENLRDHMTDLELIFTMLGEKVTTEISEIEQPDSMPKHTQVATRGGRVAGDARKATEKEIKRKVVSPENYRGKLG